MKPECRALSDKGVEVVQGNFDDVGSLIAAFEGANVVFGVTDFWAPMFNPATKAKLAPGQLINEYCFDLEVQHGKNIADAVSTIASTTLTHYIWSSLSNVRKWSKGKYTWVYHFDSKAVIYEYILQNYPELAKRTSTVQIGSYAGNFRKQHAIGLHKTPDGVYEWVKCSPGSTQFPWVDTRVDTGKFVRALVKAAPGKQLLGVSQMVSYDEYMRVWGEVLGVKARYMSVTPAEYERLWPVEVGKEVTESSLYNDEFGWDGGDPEVMRPGDLRLEEPLSTLKEYIQAQDWSAVLNA